MRSIVPTCGVVVLLGLTGACSSTATPTRTTAARTTHVTSPPTSSANPLTVSLRASLLTSVDIGPTFKNDTYTHSNQPGPCAPGGSKGVDQLVPPSAVVGSDSLSQTKMALFEEEVRTYTDADTARQAYELGKAGLSCAHGSLKGSDGTTDAIDITGPTDVTTDLGVDQGDAFEFTSTSSAGPKGGIVLARFGTGIVVLQFAADPSVDLASLPDAVTLARKAVDKAKGG